MRSALGAIRSLAARMMRSVLLMLSRRRSLGRMATRTRWTRRAVSRFVAGETLEEALDVVGRLNATGFHTTVDVLGEAVTSPELCSTAAIRYQDTLEALARRGLEGNVSLKLTQMGLTIDAALCTSTLERILGTAARTGAFVRIDMEDHTRTDATLKTWRSLVPTYPNTGVVIQAALRRSAADVDRLIGEGARIRLCKGAYDEPPAIAFVDRADVDRSFATLADRLLREGNYPAFATHDEALIRRVIETARREGVGPERFEFQMLYGVRRDLQRRLVADGYAVRVYVPYGLEWYPYFMRRLAERPANVAFILRTLFREGRGR